MDYLFGRARYADREAYPFPNLVLLDLKLPGIDGFEVLRQIKSTPLLKRLPVVILTSSKEEGDRALSYDIGANSYLVKPVSFDGFLDVVREIDDYWIRLNIEPPEQNYDQCQPIRILYVDDYPLDRELVRDVLTKENNDLNCSRLVPARNLKRHSLRGGFDVVLSDFNILGFEGLQVLEAVRAKDAEIPVIIVTGTGSEEVAVEAMKRGAADYVIKKIHHLQRLPLTIHTGKTGGERKRRDIENRYRLIFENSGEAILLTHPDGTIYSANPEACRIFQWSEAEIINLGRQGLVDPNDPRLSRALEEIRKTGIFKGELNLVRKDGTIFPAEISSTLFNDVSGNE